MASIKTAALATSAVALFGALIQLGSIAAITSFACRNADAAGTAGVPYTFSSAAATAGRRLLVNDSEYRARCSFSYSMDWWSVFYQLAIATAALVSARAEDVLLRTRTRIGILYAIAIVWVVLLVNLVLKNGTIALQNNLRDASISEKDYKDAVSVEQYGLYTSFRAYAAGGVISSIAYFLYVVLVLAEEEAVPSAKAAEAEEA